MSTQYVSFLPVIQKLSLRLRKQSILNCPKGFIQFLGECFVNLLRGEVQDFQKEDVVKYRKNFRTNTKEELFQVQLKGYN